MYQSWIKHVYVPSYSNFTSYLSGVVVGYIYHQNRHNNLNLDDFRIYNIIKRARVPLLALAYLPTFVFYRYEIPRSSWLTIIHTVLYRNAGVIAFCVTLIECFQNSPAIIRTFLASKPMTSLGKLSFAVYVLHIPMVRIVLNWIPPTLELTWWSPVWMVPSFAGIYLIGLCVYLCIEQPVSLVLKHYWLGKN
ncbi:uncharacterized protein LOC6036826 [Culex quinquefasciatus]|uniref:uncharacterized protein LOC6036826 n=1 Tax=Culex quinquefasciatus TaxID=7176 RepID=UPI0018E3415E|nr:uncharacterized protein LOC6036826 [Culex quinquefasciatus]